MLTKIFRKEIAKGKKEKRRCSKTYSDWKDDEFNCGPLKYVWGISDVENPSFSTINDLDIYFNRDNKKYFLDLDKTKEFPNTDSYIRYLEILLEDFYEYIKDEIASINPNEIDFFATDLFSGNSVAELYYKYKVFVNGFKSLQY